MYTANQQVIVWLQEGREMPQAVFVVRRAIAVREWQVVWWKARLAWS